MKIKLIDGTVYPASRVEVVNGRLEIDFADRTAEEVQAIFAEPANLAVITLLTDEGIRYGELPGWTVYGGVCLVGDTKTAILTKAANVTEERLTTAEASVLLANTKVAEAKAKAEMLEGELTQTQIALCEVYELIGGAV